MSLPSSLPLDADDIALLKSYGRGPYTQSLKTVEEDVGKLVASLAKNRGGKEKDTGLAPVGAWDLVADAQMMQQEQPLQVARNTKVERRIWVNGFVW